jgi:hypothetical protein
MLDGATMGNTPIVYRTDKFSCASWVTQTGRLNKVELEKIDLLPRARHKLLLTPGMATMFRGDPIELTQRFSLITRILDGQGLMVDGGVHGRRGHQGDYMFAWIGCTTPLGAAAWEIMAQLGSRLTFYDLKSVATPSIDDLMRSFTIGVPYKQALLECQKAVHSFLDRLFTHYGGVRGMDWQTERNNADAIEAIAHYAKLVALLRTPAHRKFFQSPLYIPNYWQSREPFRRSIPLAST